MGEDEEVIYKIEVPANRYLLVLICEKFHEILNIFVYDYGF